MIAQDVQKVFPEAVHVQDDELSTLGLQYTDMITLLTAAIQEQQAVIEQQKNQIVDLQEKYQALLIRLELLEAGR